MFAHHIGLIQNEAEANTTRQKIHIWCGFYVLNKLELAHQTENVNRIRNRDLIIPRSLINHLHSELDRHQFSAIPLAIQ